MDAYLAGYGSTDSETDDDSATNKNLVFVGPAAPTAPAAAQPMKSYHLFLPVNHPGKRASGAFPQRAASPRAPLPSLADAAAAVEAENYAGVAREAEARLEAAADDDDDDDGMPALASIERPRAKKMKPKLKGNNGVHRGTAGQRTTREPSSVSAQQRMAEFPGEGFKVQGKKLMCPACSIPLVLIKRTINAHIKSQKHKENVVKFSKQNDDQEEVKTFLEDYYKIHNDESGANVSAETKAERFKVVQGFMDAGVPLSTLGRLRALLERRGISLTDSSHMRVYIPLVQKKDMDFIEEEIGTNLFSLAVDGTRRNGEAIAGVVRWCTRGDWKLRHRLTMFKTT